MVGPFNLSHIHDSTKLGLFICLCILQDRITSFVATFLSSVLLVLYTWGKGKESMMEKGNALSLQTIQDKPPLYDKSLIV